MTNTNFPTSLDTATNPTAGVTEGSSSRVSDSVGGRSHASMHGFENDALLALEAKVGADSSAVTTSIDYKIRNIPESSLATTDLTTNDVTSTKHGFAPKSPADATKFLNGAATPAYALVKDSDLSTSDVTTNDLSTSKHGFTPKAPNDTAKFLRGDATWASPSAGFAVTTMFPQPLMPSGGNAFTPITLSSNTTMQVGLIYIPATITLNNIRVRTQAKTTSGTADIALFSLDGSTRLWKVTTPTISTINTNIDVTGPGSSVSSGFYWIAVLPLSTANFQLEFWTDNGEFWTLGNNTVPSGKPPYSGTLTVAASTIPTTITPTSISASSSCTLAARWDQ